jgi:hypothetical protein
MSDNRLSKRARNVDDDDPERYLAEKWPEINAIVDQCK